LSAKNLSGYFRLGLTDRSKIMRSFRFFPGIVLICVATLVWADDGNRASQMLTADLAQKILGSPVEAGSMNGVADTEVGKTWVSRTSYAAKAGGASAVRLSLLIRHGDGAEQAKQIFESSKNTFKGVDVAGLGDAAYRTQTPAQLNVLRGVNWIIISAGTLREANSSMQEKAAREILAKIPSS
jgi:hypothetical protein